MAASLYSVTQPTRCFSTWRKGPAWPWRTRSTCPTIWHRLTASWGSLRRLQHGPLRPHRPGSGQFPPDGRVRLSPRRAAGPHSATPSSAPRRLSSITTGSPGSTASTVLARRSEPHSNSWSQNQGYHHVPQRKAPRNPGAPSLLRQDRQAEPHAVVVSAQQRHHAGAQERVSALPLELRRSQELPAGGGRADHRQGGRAARAGARKPRLARTDPYHHVALRRRATGACRTKWRPAHRHIAVGAALRPRGRGAHTAVDGERTIMQLGDFVITPCQAWHDHGNDERRADVLARWARHPASLSSSTPRSPSASRRTSSRSASREGDAVRPLRRQSASCRPSGQPAVLADLQLSL